MLQHARCVCGRAGWHKCSTDACWFCWWQKHSCHCQYQKELCGNLPYMNCTTASLPVFPPPSDSCKHVHACVCCQLSAIAPVLLVHQQVSIGSQGDSPLSDNDIAQLLQLHLNISPAAFLQAASKQPQHSSSTHPAGQKPQKGNSAASGKPSSAAGSGGPHGQQQAVYESVEAFVGVMGKLLDLERQAEVAAAQEATSLCSTAAAQVRCHSQGDCSRHRLQDCLHAPCAAIPPAARVTCSMSKGCCRACGGAEWNVHHVKLSQPPPGTLPALFSI